MPVFLVCRLGHSFTSKEQWSEVAQSCPTLCDPVDCSLPGSSNHGILQARILEWVAISFSKEQAPFNFMTATTICSDFEAQEKKICHCFHCFPIYLLQSEGSICRDLVLWMLSFKPAFHFLLSPSSRGSLVPYHFLPWVFLSAYLSLLIYFLAILIPACDSSSPAFWLEVTLIGS